MKKQSLCLILFFIFSSTNIFAGLSRTGYLKHPLEATSGMLDLLAGDAPFPLVDAKEGIWKMSARPTYFTVDKLFYDEEGSGGGADLEGDGLNGYALSSAYAKSLNDRWQLYGMINAIQNSGTIIHKLAGINQNAPTVPSGTIVGTMDVKTTIANFSVGFGYDLIETPVNWSIPIFFGVFTQYYKTDMTATGSSSGGFNFAAATVEGSGLQYGLSGGIQLKRNIFDNFFITPYMFVGIPVNGQHLDVTVTNGNGSNINTGEKESTDLDVSPFLSTGLNFGYAPWGVSFNVLGPIYSLYSKEMFNGLKMSSYSFTFTFDVWKVNMN